jgi:dTDP-4-amino-4,6-dideoxygalactose transaminase
MNVPLLDLKRQHATIRDEIGEVIREVVESQMFIKGPKVVELEARVAEYCGSKRAVGVASGTDALLLSLMAYGVGRGDEVITTPYTFFATAGSIARLGAVPVFVDTERATYNIDPGLVEAAVTPRTKAIIPVHLYGQCADMDPLMEIANRRGLVVIEDACQSIGSEYRGKPAGSIGHAGCFSFFPSKNLGAYGDAGMVTTDDDAIADALVSLREHGMKDRYFHATIGINSRLDALQAAVLLVKLRRLDAWSDGRARNAGYYDRRFAGSAVGTPHREPHCRHIYNQYMIRVRERDALEAHLKGKGIGCALYYPLPLHLQECFRYLGYKEGGLPESEAAARETISIPVFTELAEEELDYVATTVLDFCGRG